ncbi:hypothetical protein N7539_003339 [Penicillium diatomitis]|uniref:Uncharacterized protein n=1 Tax=Penicillium diatomitis TaxID=2819901 RepID=A0A9X0C013_9EURO|nr:uncharacterized protein N7539_003339 [Penicillium diatomitis]KAJ5491772.1 hypothetical protein N7539_003339 [Penicillium diatomitis]
MGACQFSGGNGVMDLVLPAVMDKLDGQPRPASVPSRFPRGETRPPDLTPDLTPEFDAKVRCVDETTAGITCNERETLSDILTLLLISHQITQIRPIDSRPEFEPFAPTSLAREFP